MRAAGRPAVDRLQQQHDVGQLSVPHAIRAKPGRLTDAEMDVIRRHPGWGEELLAELGYPERIRRTAAHGRATTRWRCCARARARCKRLPPAWPSACGEPSLHARVVEIAAGHDLHLEAPEPWVQALRAFLAGAGG